MAKVKKQPDLNHRDFAVLALVLAGVTRGPDLIERLSGIIPKRSVETQFSVYTRRLRDADLLVGKRKRPNGAMHFKVTAAGKRAVKEARTFYESFVTE